MQDFRMETFLAVCKEMNYTRAAEALHITQPAVSQHIRYLEEYYGRPLFSFTGKKMRLTYAGTLLLDAARTQLHDEAKLLEKMQTPAEIPLTIGATLSVAEGILQDGFAHYLKRHPQQKISMVIGNTKTLLEGIDEGTLDVAFVEGYFAKGEYDHVRFRKERFRAVCANTYPSWQSLTTLESLFQELLLLREPGSGSRAILERYLDEKSANLRDFSYRTEIGSIHLIRQLIKKGCGISFLYETTVKEELAEGSIVRLPIPDMPLLHDITYLWHKNSQYEQDYRTLLEEIDMVEEDQ